MPAELRFHPDAEADLRALYDWIAREGGRARAGVYIDRIEAACRRLATFPLIGRPDEDLGAGLRVHGFERRVAIVYRIAPDAVEILAVQHGGRDFRRLDRMDENER